VLARLANQVLQAFPGTWQKRVQAVTCGNPVRESLIGLDAPAQRMAQRTGATHLLVTGGSQGARALNRLVPAAVSLLPADQRPLVIHQAGSGWRDETSDAYLRNGVKAEVKEFIDDMAGAYGWADLVICRAGALTVSELAASGVASVLVPFPHAVDDHQTRNAEFLVEAGAAEMMPEAECTAESLAAGLGRLLNDREVLLNMASAAHSVAIPDSARRVAALCREFMPA